MRLNASLPLGLAVASGLGVAYATLIERTRWTLRRVDVPVLAPGSAPLSILHVSDLHMTARQTGKQHFVRELDRLDPDLVLTTGDNIAAPDAIGPTLAALNPLLERPGAFVLGSNDYYAPVVKNPARYLVPGHPKPKLPVTKLPWRGLRDAMAEAGWADLTNATARLAADGRTVALAGVDDPHIRRDRYREIAGPADRSADVRVALTHSPEPRVLDDFTDDGYQLILAGHTHGGQVRLPYYGALVTNCGIDRMRCRGLSQWNDAWLNVSAGLGTSPYAPVRFACPPEATLLTLTAPAERPATVG